MAEHDPVRIHDEPADFGFLEEFLDAGHIGALGQPDAARIAAKTLPVMIAGDHDLGEDGFGMLHHQGEEAGGWAAGNYSQFSHPLKLSERPDGVSAGAVDERGAGL